MKITTHSYQRLRVPSEIISHAVWLYHRFCLSFREVEELLAERGIPVTYETIRHWCQTFGSDYARKLNYRILRARAFEGCTRWFGHEEVCAGRTIALNFGFLSLS